MVLPRSAKVTGIGELDSICMSKRWTCLTPTTFAMQANLANKCAADKLTGTVQDTLVALTNESNMRCSYWLKYQRFCRDDNAHLQGSRKSAHLRCTPTQGIEPCSCFIKQVSAATRQHRAREQAVCKIATWDMTCLEGHAAGCPCQLKTRQACTRVRNMRSWQTFDSVRRTCERAVRKFATRAVPHLQAVLLVALELAALQPALRVVHEAQAVVRATAHAAPPRAHLQAHKCVVQCCAHQSLSSALTAIAAALP